ncbi:MAG: hypothetical protein ACYC6Y_04965 [Thermoguttaceae bacterium]
MTDSTPHILATCNARLQWQSIMSHALPGSPARYVPAPTVATMSDQAATHVQIAEDGRTLVGDQWVTPQDVIDTDIASGLMVTLKGVTDTTLPTLDNSTNADVHATEAEMT